MLITVTFIVIFLVALNFLLLHFSCNATVKKEIPSIERAIEQSVEVNPQITKAQTSTQLAPTGS